MRLVPCACPSRTCPTCPVQSIAISFFASKFNDPSDAAALQDWMVRSRLRACPCPARLTLPLRHTHLTAPASASPSAHRVHLPCSHGCAQLVALPLTTTHGAAVAQVCMEMVMSAGFMWVAFPFTEYKVAGQGGFRIHNFLHAISLQDVYSDIMHQASGAEWLGPRQRARRMCWPAVVFGRLLRACQWRGALGGGAEGRGRDTDAEHTRAACLLLARREVRPAVCLASPLRSSTPTTRPTCCTPTGGPTTTSNGKSTAGRAIRRRARAARRRRSWRAWRRGAASPARRSSRTTAASQVRACGSAPSSPHGVAWPARAVIEPKRKPAAVCKLRVSLGNVRTPVSSRSAYAAVLVEGEEGDAWAPPPPSGAKAFFGKPGTGKGVLGWLPPIKEKGRNKQVGGRGGKAPLLGLQAVARVARARLPRVGRTAVRRRMHVVFVCFVCTGGPGGYGLGRRWRRGGGGGAPGAGKRAGPRAGARWGGPAEVVACTRPGLPRTQRMPCTSMLTRDELTCVGVDATTCEGCTLACMSCTCMLTRDLACVGVDVLCVCVYAHLHACRALPCVSRS
jgi:hypothetical protein